jgi:uncharacterized SAM-binding protein YcdF (DUF218 family)
MDLSALSKNVIDEITEIVFGIPIENPKPCDVIFIFGGSHPGLWQKVAEACFAGLGKAIVVTGGYKPTAKKHFTWIDDIKTPESHVIKRELIRLGVPEKLIYCEDKSTNSLENVIFAKDVFDFSRVSSVLLVCKCYGVGRQCRTFKQNIGKPMEIIPYPFNAIVGNNTYLVTRENWMHDGESRYFILTEAAKIYAYGNKGDLEPVLDISDELELLLMQYAHEKGLV